MSRGVWLRVGLEVERLGFQLEVAQLTESLRLRRQLKLIISP